MLELMLKHLLVFSLLVFLMPGCAPSSVSSQQIANGLEEKVECRDLEKFFWIELHQATLENRNPKSWKELKDSFLNSKNLNLQRLGDAVLILETHLTNSFWNLSPSEQTEIWAQLELRIDEKPGFSKLIAELSAHFSKHQAGGTENCFVVLAGQQDQLDLSYGARRVMQIAYQSCEASQMAALDSSVTDIIGISVVGTHPDKIGSVRKITDLAQVQKTHPYLRIQNKDPDCFDLMKKPLIYDYGGKPAYASALTSEIDLFRNSGSGSSELGIDCSAFVIASLGVKGFRLKPNENLEARQTAAFGTSTLIRSPDFFPCLEYIKIGKGFGIQPGDIVTVVGHTLIIDSMGADPFGLMGLQSESACLGLDGSKFDFKISHSSPIFGAVGINRTDVRDYLRLPSKMTNGLIKYARNQCLLSLKNTSSQPRWSDVSIVRHKNTAECRGLSLTAKYQKCVETCRP